MCPRRCGADRAAGERGYCGAGRDVEIYRYGRHGGEEPPISGRRGSGTVFFSRCTMRCLYCQNHPWSQEGAGWPYDVNGLAGILEGLAASGCHNWNLVSPTPWLPPIEAALDRLKRAGVSLPVVYNTSGFERVETLQAVGRWVGVYLTDLRYARRQTATAASECAEYVTAARAALLEMWRQKGGLALDGEGTAVSGVVCRLLVLPGHSDEAVENLEWLAANVGPRIAVSVMAQYTPVHRALNRPPWNRTVTAEEYGPVCDAAERLGFRGGWVQEFGGSAEKGLLGTEMKPCVAGERSASPPA
jgi:putative pyruvate formate lyase activating enzyme